MPASPPGKSARADPPSGMNSVSPTKAASPMTCVMQAGVWPGVWIARHVHLADRVGVAVVEQPVELRAVALELGALVEDLAEGVLHDGDVAADAELAAQLLLDVGRGGQVVGMDMGLDQPLDREAVRLDEGDDLVGVVVGDAPGGVVDVHDGIDDGAGVRRRVLDDVGDRVGRRVEEGGDVRTDVHVGFVCHRRFLRGSAQAARQVLMPTRL